MTTVVFLEDRRPSARAEDTRGRLPLTRFLNDLAREADDLSGDWLFQMASPEAKRRMLAERGFQVRETA